MPQSIIILLCHDGEYSRGKDFTSVKYCLETGALKFIHACVEQKDVKTSFQSGLDVILKWSLSGVVLGEYRW